jgi:hypothetical protein
MAKTDDKIILAAKSLLDDEDIRAVLIASPRGHQTAVAGGIAGEIGIRKQGKAMREAGAVGLEVKPYMALVLTPTRLASVKRDSRGRVTELLGAVPLEAVENAEIKRFGLGGHLTLTVAGAQVKLECRVGDGRAFADALLQGRRTAA